MKTPRAIEVMVYFVDPKDIWAWSMEKLAVIYHAELVLPWLWLARRIARANQGNTGNTGYLIRYVDNGELIENIPPDRPWVTCL